MKLAKKALETGDKPGFWSWQNVIPWYMPAIIALGTSVLIAIFVAVIINQSSISDQEHLSSDLFSLSNAFRIGIKGNLEFLNLLSEDYAEGRFAKTSFKKRAKKFFASHHELQNLKVYDKSGSIDWTFPPKRDALLEDHDHQSVLELLSISTQNGEVALSEPYINLENAPMIAIAVPIIRDLEIYGAVIGIYSLAGLVETAIGMRFIEKYRIQLVDEHNHVWVDKSQPFKVTFGAPIEEAFQFESFKIKLRIERYKAFLTSQTIILAIICVGLVIGLAAALWWISRDSHRRELLVKELEKAKVAAESANRAKTELIANISHEMRTPLGVICGFAETLNQDAGTRERQFEPKRAITSIIDQSKHLLGLVNDFLDISKIDAGLLEIDQVTFDLQSLLDEVADLFKDVSSSKNVQIHFVLDPDTPSHPYSDPHRIKQILINLVGNAIKFTSEGSIKVEVGYLADSDLPRNPRNNMDANLTTPCPESLAKDHSISSKYQESQTTDRDTECMKLCPEATEDFIKDSKEVDQNKWPKLGVDVPPHGRLIFAISDTGMGIAPENFSILFQRFTQGDSSISRRYGGTGLGLAISQRLATLLGGSLRLVYSELGKGSSFEFVLPCDSNTAKSVQQAIVHQAEKADEQSQGGTLKLRILLVEDCLDNQIIYQEFLRSITHSIDLANNGQEGVTCAQQNSYDIIFMDIQMPVMDGYQATRLIREFNKNVVMIALTAHAMKGERERCLEAGCQGYLTKPVSKSQLIEITYRLVREHQANLFESPFAKQSPLPKDDRELIKSSYDQDPRIGKLLAGFTKRLEQRVDLLEKCWQEGNQLEFAQILHQIKGSASNYGYHSIAQHIENLELSSGNRNNAIVELRDLVHKAQRGA